MHSAQVQHPVHDVTPGATDCIALEFYASHVLLERFSDHQGHPRTDRRHGRRLPASRYLRRQDRQGNGNRGYHHRIERR